MKLLILNISLLLLIYSGCNTTEPDNRLEISVEDVSCTEAWIKVTGETGNEITLNRDGKEVERLTLKSSPQTIYDDSLLPNTNYQYQVSGIGNQESPEGTSSNQLQVTTLDTTSHDFTYTTYTFGGQAGSCAFYDCAIVNDTLAYAVGEVYLNDSIGQPDPFPYNFAEWNGKEWRLRKIEVEYKNNQTIVPLTGVFVLGDGKIILSSGLPYLPNGNGEWKLYHLWDLGVLNQNNGSVNHIWGSSINDLFFAEAMGTIVHYSNGNWQKIESGTDVNINDVWGVVDEYSNHEKVFCAVTNVLELSDHKILTIDGGNNVDSLHWDQDRRINSVWSNNGRIVYTSGGGVFNNKSGKWKEETSLPLYYTNRIRGNGLNDIFVAGDFGFLAHFNGAHWKIYDEFLFSASSLSVTVKGDMVIAIGRMGEQALIIMGKRN